MPDVNLGTIYTQLDIDTSPLNQKAQEISTTWESISKDKLHTTLDIDTIIVNNKIKEIKEAWESVGAVAAKGSKEAEISQEAIQKANDLKAQVLDVVDAYRAQIDVVEKAKAAVMSNPPKQNTTIGEANEIRKASEALIQEMQWLRELESELEASENKVFEFAASQKKLASETRSAMSESVEALESYRSKTQEVQSDVIKAHTEAANRIQESADKIAAAASKPAEQKIELNELSVEDRIEYILGILQQLGIEGRKAEDILQNCFADVSVLKAYERQLQVILTKLQQQRDLLTQLNKKAENPGVGRNSARESAKAAEQIEKEKVKLLELERQYEDTYAKQDAYVKKAVNNYTRQSESAQKAAERQSALNQKMDMREAGANMKVGTDLVASGLRTLDQVAPGVAGNIGNIITQINTARTAMEGMSSTPMKWAMGISAAVGVAATLVMAGIKQMQEAEEERQRAFEEGVNKVKEYGQNIVSLEANLKILKDEKSATDAVKSAREALANTFPDLIAGYDKEGKAILKNTDLITEYIEKQKEAKDLARDSIIANSSNAESEFKKAKDEYEKLTEQYEAYKQFLGGHNEGQHQSLGSVWNRPEDTAPVGIFEAENLDELFKKLIDAEKELNSKTDALTNRWSAMIEKRIKVDVNGVISDFDQLGNVQQAVANAMKNDLINTLKESEEPFRALQEGVQKH